MPFFINADLEILSREDPQLLRENLGDAVVEMGCVRHDDGTWFASFEISAETEQHDPEPLIRRFCDLIDALSPGSRIFWDSAVRRVVDLGYQSDESGNVVRSSLPVETLARLAGLSIELAVTIYPLPGKLER